jgi:hypothetical protein
METMPVPEQRAADLRPVARWTTALDDRGRERLAMTWYLPDPDSALSGLGVAHA